MCALFAAGALTVRIGHARHALPKPSGPSRIPCQRNRDSPLAIPSGPTTASLES